MAAISSSFVPKKVRAFVFTLNATDDDHLPEIPLPFDESYIRYMVYQLEKGDGGRCHFQGYLYLVHPVLIKTLVNKFGPRLHWAVARGTPRENEVYCTKEDSRLLPPCIFGEIPHGRYGLWRYHSF